MKLFPRLALATTIAAALGATGAAPALAQQSEAFRRDERLLQEGLALFDREQYGAAQQDLRRYLDQAGRRTDHAPAAGADTQPAGAAEAEYYYALAGLNLAHPDAEGLLLAFAARHPVHPRTALAYFELARFYFDQKNYPPAIAYFQKVAPDNLSAAQRAEADFKLAYSYFEQKDYAKARLLFDRNKQVQSQYRYASSYYAGYLAYRANDYAAARQDLGIAEQNDAYKLVVPAVLAQIYYKEGNYDDLIAYAGQALNRTPPPASADEIQLLAGDAYYQKQNFPQATPYFDKYAAAHKQIEPALQYKIGFANYKTGDYAGAIASFKPLAARRDSLGQNAAYHLGLSYLQTKQPPYALTAFDAARQTGFDRGIAEQATLKLAQVHFELGNRPEVIAALRGFEKKFPRSKNQPAVDDLLSASFLSSNDYAQALAYLDGLDERSAKLNATYQRVAYYQAATRYNDGQYAEALPLLEKSLKYPEDDALRAAAQVLRGEIYSVGQQYAEAIAAYTAAARTVRQGGVTPEEAEFEQKARYGLGYAYYNTQQYARARTQFQAFLSDPDAQPTDPNYYDATLRLADTYYVAKSYPAALDLYNKVIEARAAGQDYAYYQKGVTLGALGRRAEASQTLGDLLKTAPDSRLAEQAVFQQAQLDFEAGDYGPAAAGFSRLIEGRSPGSALLAPALHKRGVAYANLAQPDKAVADFRRVLAEFPRSEAAGQAIYSLQESLAALGRPEEFDAALSQFKQQNPASKATESVEFEAAKSLYLAEKYALALTRFTSFMQQYPASALSPDARYFVADAYLKTGNQAEALPRLRAVVEEGKSEYVNRAAGRVADVEFENKNYPEAIRYYQRLKQASTNRREVATATLGLLRATYESGDDAGTRRLAEDLRGQAGATAGAGSAALLYLGKASLRQGSLDLAVAELRAAVAAAPADASGAEAQYLLGQALLQQKKYPDALAEALKVNSNYASYELWQGRAFLLVADIYAAQGEIFQARGTLTSIVENKFPVPEIVAAARERLKALPADENEAANPVSDRPEQAPPTRRPAAKAPAKTPAAGPPAGTAKPGAPGPAKPAPAAPAPARGKAPARPRTPPILPPAPRQ